jgi:hypothetical protein
VEEMREESQRVWMEKVYCPAGRQEPSREEVHRKYGERPQQVRHPHDLQDLTAQDLQETLASWGAAKAGGTDGWGADLFKRVPPSLLQWLASLLNLIEGGAGCPPALAEGMIALIPKKATAGAALDQRPITLTNLAYRIWSGTRCRQSSDWLRAWFHPRAGGGPGKGPETCWGPISVRAETARLEGCCLAGFSADLWKYYDLIDPGISLGFLKELGLSDRIFKALTSFYG